LRNITYQELKTWEANKKTFQLVDVREDIEHEAYNIGGILIPLSEILKSKNQLLTDHPIVFYCKKGIRSQLAIQKLMRYFPQAKLYNLQAGIGTSPDDLNL